MATTIPSDGFITFLFTEIDGAARMWEQHPGAMAQAILRHNEIIQQAVAAHKGYVFQTIGDAFCVAFAQAGDGISSAVEIGQGWQQQDWSEQLGAIKVKAALHSGPATQRGVDYFAPHTLNRLSRILAAAHGGQILISATTQKLAQDAMPEAVSLRDMGVRRLRDLSQPERLFQVLAPDLPASFAPLKTLDARPNNLPAQPNLLVDRLEHIAAISAMLRRNETRLVTLIGPGGTGKTRLATQTAAEMLDEFEAGCYFIPLAPVSEQARVIAAIALALEVREEGGQSLNEALKAYLADRQMLLVLDNFEQVVAAAALVDELLAAAPRLKVLVTSREGLRLDGEVVYPVPPLDLPDLQRLPLAAELADYASVSLFVQRASAVNFNFSLSPEDAAAVAEICVRLDGLPLAIELAAAHSRTLPAAEMLNRLSNRLTLLVQNTRDRTARQQSLRGMIDWSYDLLGADERLLFSRMAMFVGGADAKAVATVCNPEGGLDAAAILTQLAHKSLLRLVPVAENEAEARFTMLETIREYAADRFGEDSAGKTLLRRYAHYYLDLAETAEPELRGAKQAEWLTRLAEEQDNLRAALNWGLEYEPELALRLVGALGRFWEIRGLLSEGRASLIAALDANSEADAVYRAKALNSAGNLAFWHDDYAAASEFYSAALTLRRQMGDRQGVAASLNNLANIAAQQGDYQSARPLYEESLTIRRELNDRVGAAPVLYNLGNIARGLGNYKLAQYLYEECLTIEQELGDDNGAAGTVLSLAEIALYQANYHSAHKLYSESLAIRQKLENKPGIVQALGGLALIAYSEGDYEQAKQYSTDMLNLSKEIEYTIQEAYAYSHFGSIVRASGDFKIAQAELKKALVLFWQLGHTPGITETLIRLAIAIIDEGTLQSAQVGTTILGASTKIQEIITWLPVELAQYEQALQLSRSLLGEADFEAVWHTGSTMNTAEVVDYASVFVADKQLHTCGAKLITAVSVRTVFT